MKKPKEEVATWGVYLLRKKADRIGSVDAKDEKEALLKAVEELEIPEISRMRVNVVRE